MSVGVLGAGAWGTALALVATRAGNRTVLWGRDAAVVDQIGATGRNERYLPGVDLAGIMATTDLAAAAAADVVLLVVPARACPDLAHAVTPHLAATAAVVLCAKGIDPAIGGPVGETVARHLGRPAAVLSGPSFARDVARGRPTAVVVAAADMGLAERLVAQLGSATFRPYASADPRGVELCGVVKNVLAIACGICIGRGLGESARAALVTRGLAELTRLGTALGVDPATVTGLAGLGDLTLTCTSPTSRNFSYGLALGSGAALPAPPEGVFSAGGIARLAATRGVDMPIVAAVDRVISGAADLDAVIGDLLARPFRRESGDAIVAP